MTTVISSKKYSITYGILLGIISVGIGVLLYTTGSLSKPPVIYMFLGAFLPIGIISFGIWKYKTDLATPLRWNDALKVGIGISLIAGIIGAGWEMLLTQYLEPDFIENSIALQRELSAQNPDLSEAQIEQGIAMSRKLSTPVFMISLSLIKSLFFGFVISAIAGAIMQRIQKQ